MTLNGRTATSTNIFMIKGSVEVMNYSTPGSGATTSDTIPMVFEAKTGTNSFDDGATPTNNLCVQCHQNAVRPGSGTNLLSVNGDHAGLDEFQGNEQGNDCTGCHQHDYDANVATTDGFMPLKCDDCHESPPSSGAHLAHAGTGSSQYGFECGRCHNNNLHNEAGVLGAAGYNAASLTIANLIDVNFDSLNPAGSYTPAKGSRTTPGAGTCAALYCHGMAPPQPARWDSAGSVSCGTCHGDSTGRPTAPPSGGSHQTPSHQVSCGTCHTHNGGPAGGEHVNGSANINGDALVSAAGSGITAFSYGAHLGTDGDGYEYSASSCTPTCHGEGVWGEKGDCAFCHGYPPNSTNNQHARGVSAANHDAAAITPNHGQCWFCHGVRNDGSDNPSVMGTDVLKGSYIYSWTSDHFNGKTTMNGNANADTSDDAGYNTANGGCDTVACHGNDALHRVGSGSAVSVALRDMGPGSCSTCHGTDGVRFYPDSAAQNGTVYPNRAGKHAGHVSIIASRNALATTNGDTCVWCHPGGAHSGDPSSPPADLHDGTATHFRDIIGNADSGEAVAQSVAAATVTCAGVNCHYNKPPPGTEWYGTATGGCDYCHTYAGDYLPGALPNAHDVHVDAWADGGYAMAGIFCLDCHQDTGQYMPFGGRHQNGIAEVAFAYLANNNPTDGNEAAIAGTGPLAGAVKYGGGTSADYYSCAGLYCHGDFDDQAGLGGGNASNTPNWFNTTVDGACGTCHGDPSRPDVNRQAAPMAGNSGSIHANHIDLETTPAVNCSVCHRDVAVPLANGTYGDFMRHVDGQILVALNHINPINSFVVADYELSAAALSGVYGSYTCSNIKCHNGVTTPLWSDASIPGFACGQCHNDGTGQSPLPVWAPSVTGSHGAHANTDAVYSDCAKCHGPDAANYAATGGTNHQNLVVDLSLPGTGAVYADSPVGDSGGVNHPQVGGPGDRIDNGTCTSVSCHGGGTPVWGGAGPIECGICHGKTLGTEDRSSWGLTPDVQGAPPLTAGGGTGVYRVGKHQAHVDESSAATGDACDLCHLGAGSGAPGLHGDLQTQVSFHPAAGASAVYDSSTIPPTCSNLDFACHGTGQWDTNATPPCDFCHGYPPSSANNRHAIGVSPVNHDSANITPNHGECWFCHGVRDSGASQPAVMGTSALKGSYIYSWTADHRDGRTTMNGNANADTSDDAGYNTGDGGCDTAFCHGNDAIHRVGNGSAQSVTLRDLGPGSCTACHGTDNFNYYPDGGTQNGTAYPNRAGRHAVHVFFIASRNALSSADAQTCDWCHPAGGHTGDQYSLPADLHDGSTSHFKDVIGNIDSGEAVAQGGTAGTVSCSGVNCHYNNAPPADEWYGGLSMGCDYCHVAYPPYTPGDLPGAHDLHCDDEADGGYGMNDWGNCMACHYTLFNYDHQDGVVQVLFDDPFGIFPDDGDATAVSNGGPLTGKVKYGGGSTNDYYSCTGIYCHGDFDDGGIGGGNAANAPNWFDTVSGSACGTCHGDTGGADQTHQALPVTGTMDTIHANHVDMDPGVSVDCSVCHYTLDANNGTYGMNSLHADNTLQVAMRPAASGSIPGAGYEGGTASVAGSYGTRTCSTVVCHNGVTTPTWSDSSSVACGSCHQDTAGTGPLPSWEGSVGRSHAAHANTDATYTDCAVCHLATAANYTATGGTNHQDLVVQIAPGGGSYSESLGGAGVDWTSGSDGVDDGTCSVASCHGAGTPVWGDPSSLVCGDCHGSGLNGAPVVTASSTHVDADGAGGTYSAGACENCHAGHVGLPGTVTIPLPPVSWSNANMPATSMRTQLGINYVSHNGIAIGGTTSQIPSSIRGLTTEAEICWGCHSSLATQVSEWGFNTKTNTTVATMDVVWAAFPTQGDGTAESKNYGWIYDSTYTTKVTDWTTGHWMSAYDPLLKRRVASVHSANFDITGQSSSVAANITAAHRVRQGTSGNPMGDPSEPVLEDAGQIRCSYCHDVHGTFGPSGKPHLRGTWVGDPYPPELPPRSTYTYTKKVSTLAGNRVTPRALASSRDRGGYFIDQNSNSPTLHTSMDTIAETAGLCTLCHGTDIDRMDYYSSANLWRFAPPGKNGHSNSALCGTRVDTLISDLFTGSRYGAGMGMQNQVPRSPWVCDDYGNCDTNYPQAPLVMWSCETNCNNLVNSGWFNTIRTGTTSPMGGDFTNWYGTGTIGGINQAGAKAHNFTCSKCHSPHATGLPALLTQNCIDPALGNFTINGFTGTNLIANNCHRKTNVIDGWHTLYPGQ